VCVCWCLFVCWHSKHKHTFSILRCACVIFTSSLCVFLYFCLISLSVERCFCCSFTHNNLRIPQARSQQKQQQNQQRQQVKITKQCSDSPVYCCCWHSLSFIHLLQQTLYCSLFVCLALFFFWLLVMLLHNCWVWVPKSIKDQKKMPF